MSDFEPALIQLKDRIMATQLWKTLRQQLADISDDQLMQALINSFSIYFDGFRHEEFPLRCQAEVNMDFAGFIYRDERDYLIHRDGSVVFTGSVQLGNLIVQHPDEYPVYREILAGYRSMVGQEVRVSSCNSYNLLALVN